MHGTEVRHIMFHATSEQMSAIQLASRVKLQVGGERYVIRTRFHQVI